MKISKAFLLEESFKCCKVHDNKAVWNLSRSCQIPLTIQPQTESKYHIANKKRSGKFQ
jgi:hypothetical protein